MLIQIIIILYQVFPGSPGYWQRIFFHAVKNGDFQVVKNMVQFFKDSCLDVIHSKETASGNGSLHLACRKGHFDIAQELLENGVSLHARNANGLTPFFFAAERQHRKICQLLIEWGCDVQAKDLKNHTAFDGIRSEKFRKFLLSYYAFWSSAIPVIIHGDTDILEDIVHNHLKKISFMSSPRSRCINGSTLLHTAAYFGKTDTIKTLLQLTVGVNLLDYKGATPLHRSRDTETMQLLIDHGADVNWSDVDGNTPLHIICFGEMRKPARLDCLKLLLSHKAAIEKWNNKELLPIHCAAMQGRIDVIQLLLQFASKQQMITKLMKGSAPSLLYLSVANSHIECAKWLTEKGFNFKAEEQEELLFGLLHDEIEAPVKVESLEFLIKNGVNINAVDKHGDSSGIKLLWGKSSNKTWSRYKAEEQSRC
ncbi:poly [ADP-ribose] polymerase tankyrase-2-like isoform X3 [Heterodontus francisci]|uniref:poly [ADP-ribose] polymerase tankyrase-2-like isoform X3 n=1 Tax=Heterodontus francisci TaxID=7792 RepID=UPI00355C0C66